MDFAKIEADAAELEKVIGEVQPMIEAAAELLKKVSPTLTLALDVFNKLKSLHLA